MKKLSKAQQAVIDCLKENEGSYIKTSPYYRFQEVVSKNEIIGEFGTLTHHLMYFTEPTLYVLRNYLHIIQQPDLTYTL